MTGQIVVLDRDDVRALRRRSDWIRQQIARGVSAGALGYYEHELRALDKVLRDHEERQLVRWAEKRGVSIARARVERDLQQRRAGRGGS